MGLFDAGGQSHNTVHAPYRFILGIYCMTVSRSCKGKRLLPKCLDLLQVDLLEGRARTEPCLAAKRPTRATKSREVDLSHLMGFHLHFTPKMVSGVTRIWGFRFHL